MTTLDATGARAVTTPAEAPDVPRKRRSWLAEDIYALVASAISGLALTWLLYERILPTSGALGFLVCWYVSFLLIYVVMLSFTSDRLAVKDRLSAAFFTTAGCVMLGSMVFVLVYTLARGFKALRVNFFTQTMSFAGPLSPLSQGGIKAAIMGSLEQVGIALAIAVPLGVITALYLNEIGGRFARIVRLVVDAMSALPEIIAGLFIYATVILALGFNKSGLAAALAIGVMMLPIITRTSEVVFRLVPSGLREASFALGSSQWRTAWNVVLPTARAGLVTAVVLGIARGVGETAPVLLTAGFTAEFNADPIHGPQVSLPLYILNYIRYPQDNMVIRAYGAALALTMLVCFLFILARIFGGGAPGELSRRQRRKLKRASSAAEMREAVEVAAATIVVDPPPQRS
jgi:phosphate transport system permease protein